MKQEDGLSGGIGGNIARPYFKPQQTPRMERERDEDITTVVKVSLYPRGKDQG